MATIKKSLPELLVGMVRSPVVLQDINVTSIRLDSRQVQAGGLFLSLAHDIEQRQQYLQQALDLGAVVVLFDNKQSLTEQEVESLDQAKVPAYPIKNLLDKMSEIAARFYGHPSLALTIIAVTGTNGKTSVSQFIAQSLEFLGHACGVIGTLGVGRLDQLDDTGMTTPDPISLQAILAEFCHQDIHYVVIEASSHALDQGRLNSVAIDVAVLTNLSRDHLDYHQDMTGYAAAKSQLFNFASIKTAVINQADSLGQTLLTTLAGNDSLSLLSYSSDAEDVSVTLQAQEIQSDMDGLQFNVMSEFGSTKIHSPLLGQFNVDNLLATVTSLLAIGLTFDDAMTAIQHCHSVDGRMQRYGSKQQPQVVIDFAHTPDALTQTLQSLRFHLTPNSLLWCVFGCGGDRDVGKRALMGTSAELNADKVILTDDNPRSEDPDVIVSDILSGITDRQKIQIEHDRKLAITHAINSATVMDIVLVAGKGHEQYQEIARVRYPFNDADVVVKSLQTYRSNVDILAEVQA